MESTSAINVTGVQLPTFPMVSGELARLIDISGAISPTSTEESGEYYAMSFVQVLPAELVLVDSIMVIPLVEAPDEVAFDFTFLATAPLMFILLHETPQPLRTYGRCVGYMRAVGDLPLALGAMLRFTTIPQFVIAKRDMAKAVRESSVLNLERSVVESPEKRQCVRTLGDDGEGADDALTRTKGTSIYLLDLDGAKHFTRNKSEIAVREKELYFLFRAMDSEKQEYCIASDVTLQTEVYRRMLCEQGDTQSEDRTQTFLSCGLMSRIQKLRIFPQTEKLKLLLMGHFLLEGTSEPTLLLEDFSTGEVVSSGSNPCPSNNSGLIAVLKNFQIVMQITFSEFFATCLDAFIENLEGAYRPMEVAAADFLKHSVELNLRKIFRIIRSVKGSSLGDIHVQTPEQCAALIISSFDKLAEDLSDHNTRSRQDAYFRVKMARKAAASSLGRSGLTNPKVDKAIIRFADNIKEEKGAPGPSKICSGHIGKQLSAVRKDGRPYTCSYEKDCTFQHVSIVGKTTERLLEIASAMPPPMKQDLTRAINLRKK